MLESSYREVRDVACFVNRRDAARLAQLPSLHAAVRKRSSTASSVDAKSDPAEAPTNL
jgi:hypothetical protein